MRQPLIGKMDDNFSTKITNTDKGPITNFKTELKSLFGPIFELKCHWNSRIVDSTEEEEKVFVQRSSVKGDISFPRGSILRFDENERILYFEVANMEFNKDKNKLALEVTDDFLVS